MPLRCRVWGVGLVFFCLFFFKGLVFAFLGCVCRVGCL